MVDGLDTEAGTNTIGIGGTEGVERKATRVRELETERVVRIRRALPPVVRLPVKILHENTV